MIVSHTPGSALERKRAARLDIARRLDQALVTQDPDRVITRCDSGGRMVARERRHLHLSSSLQRDRLSVSFSVGGTMTVKIDGVEPNIFPDVEDLDARDAGRNVEVFLDIRVEGKPTPVTVKLSYEQASDLATLLEPFRKP